MKILHTSDWHLGKSLYDFSLIEDQSFMLDRLVELIENENIDAVIIAGDVYDRPVTSSYAIELYDSFLSRVVSGMGIPVLAIAGNHDSGSRLEFGSSLYSSAGYHICGQARAVPHCVTLTDSHGDINFWLVPYLQPAQIRPLFPDETVRSFDDAYRTLLTSYTQNLDSSQRNIAIAHGFFSPIGSSSSEKIQLLTSDSEVNIGGMDIVNSDIFSPFDYVALGHLHAPQRAGSDFIRYSGSPLKYSLSEEKQPKSFTIIDIGGKGELDIRTVSCPALRDVRTVAGNLDQLLDPDYHTVKAFDDYIFAELLEEGALYPMEKLRTLLPNLLGLRVRSDSEDMMPSVMLGERRSKLSATEMFCRFYTETKGHDMSPEMLAFLQQTLDEYNEQEEACLCE